LKQEEMDKIVKNIVEGKNMANVKKQEKGQEKLIDGYPDYNQGLPNLSELVDEKVIITGFLVNESEQFQKPDGTPGEWASVNIKDMGSYLTSSEIVIKQLNEMEPNIKKYGGVRAILRKVKNYYTFK
jgi:hypothetical protein